MLELHSLDVDIQFDGPAKGVICIKGEGHTKPTDTCRQFSPNRSVDNQDLNRWIKRTDIPHGNYMKIDIKGNICSHLRYSV